MERFKQYAPGLVGATFIAIVATYLGTYSHLIGGTVIAIMLGILINNTFGKPESMDKGLKFTSKRLLKTAIVFMGANLSLMSIFAVGKQTLIIMLFTLTSAFLSGYVFGKLMGISFNLRNLIAAGTGICGGSAIAALSPIVEADDSDIAYAISATFIFDIAAVLLFPVVGMMLGMSDLGFGMWVGTAVNDTSSVVAAGYAYSEMAGNYATIVKLTRTTAIVPITLIFSLIVAARKKKSGTDNEGSAYSIKKIFPWFILGFLGMSILNTMGIFNETLLALFKTSSKFMIVMALAAIGLNTDFKQMSKSGIRPLILGFIVSMVVVFVSLFVQFQMGIV